MAQCDIIQGVPPFKVFQTGNEILTLFDEICNLTLFFNCPLSPWEYNLYKVKYPTIYKLKAVDRCGTSKRQ